jgi:hypothetical protein
VASSSYSLFEAEGQYVRARSCLFHTAGHFFHVAFSNYGGISDYDTCLFATCGELAGAVRATNCIWVRTDTVTRERMAKQPIRIRLDDGTEAVAEGGDTLVNCALNGLMAGNPATVRACTVVHSILLQGGPHTISDSIVGAIQSQQPGTRIDHCDVFRSPGYADFARPGPGCFAKDPLFLNPTAFDFRLRVASPCRKQASDGGDLGCRYTPQMLELLKKALELRERGLFRFSNDFGP